ncbi:hypothetical protein CRUP_038789, partial [Coryphaenoides rupestris]
VIKEFLRIGVRVYVTGCDDQIMRKMEAMVFFDEVVSRDLLFVSVHDAVLHIQSEQLSALQDNQEVDQFDDEHMETSDNQHTAIHGLSN